MTPDEVYEAFDKFVGYLNANGVRPVILVAHETEGKQILHVTHSRVWVAGLLLDHERLMTRKIK